MPAVTDWRDSPLLYPQTRSEEVVVGIGVSLILIAVGAVLAFAVHVTTSGFNVNTVGYILLIVGAIGALISLVFWSSWGGVGGSRRRTVVEDEVV
jgi:beta-lactamase regulating signal transducer with metallopeptidase domain